jgi:superfamily II DNA or RNA helicase
METKFKAGTLVSLHQRDWVVLPSKNEQIIRLKPLGGTDQEIKGIFKGFPRDFEALTRAKFPLPSLQQIGSFHSARLLYNAARLSFRNGAGPFRSMGKLSFQPRSYQLVPLIMALKLQGAESKSAVRLLIADDVGVGKTIEALLIVREMLDRGDINRFAVVCLPHLCDQWQQELKDKFGIDAVIIRSGSVKRLERNLHGDATIFQHYPFQIISIDYIKGERKRNVFIQHAPEMIVVDEAHTCAQTGGAQASQQQRHQLVKDIAQNPDQHLLLLTATPHSGKSEEFQSILGLLHPEFAEEDLITANAAHKKRVAQHFVQRRRKNVEKWLDEETVFPERISLEQGYPLSKPYREVFYEAMDLARKLAVDPKNGKGLNERLRYYMAIGLLRGIMSSPATGEAMLQNRLRKYTLEPEQEWETDSEEIEVSNESILDGDFDTADQAPTELASQAKLSGTEQKAIRSLTLKMTQLKSLEHDLKAKATLQLLEKWLKTNNTLVFCRYIQTANYLKKVLEPALLKTFGKKLVIEVITSELADEERKEKVRDINEDKRSVKLIIATDCMSEGINLQEKFSAVLHYDLPWNPNRLEQREGRVDRFGQTEKKVNTLLLYGEDNPIDGTVLKVLLRKARKIRQAIGISVPFPDDSKSIMDAVLTAVLLNPKKQGDLSVQSQLDFGDDDAIRQKELEISQSFERIQEREKQITSIFAQNSIKPDELSPYIHETEAILGNAEAVQSFLEDALPLYHSSLSKTDKAYQIHTINLPLQLQSALPKEEIVEISFESPTPPKLNYIGRNHAFIENLCLKLLEDALSTDTSKGISRAAVFQSSGVHERTTIYLLRIRNVVADAKGKKELVAEEMKLWGFTGSPNQESLQTQCFEAEPILNRIEVDAEVSTEIKEKQLKMALADYHHLKNNLNRLAEKRARHMIKGHEQFNKEMKKEHLKAVEPILPPDVLGVYVILPLNP